MDNSGSNINQLIDHLFRHEYGKLVSVLTRVFGPENIELAEDVVQDSLISALKEWTYKGIPQNQTAWLYKVARNKALNILNREKYKRKYFSEAVHFSHNDSSGSSGFDMLISNEQILDDQLRMMFVCCNPSISKDSQVILTLKTLCGFSMAEIAHAFFTTEETINKRLVRSRQKIREAKIHFDVPPPDLLEKRLDAVLETIYLLFNEGYSASTGEHLIRYELCQEAMRLTEVICLHPAVLNKSNVYALLSLMLLNASRFNSRIDNKGQILTLSEQDRSGWDKSLMQKGFFYLAKSTGNQQLSIYHILATISAYHCSAADFESTDWKSILSMYDHLLELDRSPIVLLNRSVAVSKVMGLETAINDLLLIRNNPFFKTYHLFYSTLAEFYMLTEKFQEAVFYLKKAIDYSPLRSEKELLTKKLNLCMEKNS